MTEDNPQVINSYTAPVFCDIPKKAEVALNINEGQRLLRRHSLSHSETNVSLAKDRLLTLKSPSESELLFHLFRSSMTEPNIMEKGDKVPELIATNVDDDEDDSETVDVVSEYCCSCGCDEVRNRASEIEPEIDSEDEGCYIVTNGSQFSSVSPVSTGASKSGTALMESPIMRQPPATLICVENNDERRSFSFSVDSGRSSHSATSTSSSSKSSRSASEAGEESVKIVSHSFCDVLSTHKDKIPAKSEPTNGMSSNKVTVFVPFSTISEMKRQESQKPVSSSNVSTHNVEHFSDNVVICDTQVILRINCQPHHDEAREDQEEEEEVEGNAGEQTKSNKGFSRRMARRMTTTVAVYEMIHNKQNRSHDESTLDDYANDTVRDSTTNRASSSTADVASLSAGKSSSAASCQYPPKRKKDLCKLLGLIEYDVATDSSNPDDLKLAQKVALDNLISALQKQTLSKENEEEEDQKPSIVTTTPRKGAKKDLAKFLGVEDEESSASGKQNTATKKHKLINWSQFMKTSMRWKPNNDFDDESKNSYRSLSLKDADLDLSDVQFLQLKSANEVLFGTDSKKPKPSRTNQKNLNKYLGMDDSDSEEMVFIQNKKKVNNSSNEAEDGSVNVVGIRIESADDDSIDDEIVDVSSDCDSIDSDFDSTMESRSDRKSSLNNFFRRRSSQRNLSRHKQSTALRSLSAAATQHRHRLPDEMPPRKSVLFKEYRFDVEDSIAQGLPIIPPLVGASETASSHRQTSTDSANSSYTRVRKKKKDAARRTAEVRFQQHHQVHYPPHPRQRHDQKAFQPPPPMSSRDDNWLFEKIEAEAVRFERPPPKPGKKVQRGAMVRKHRLLIPGGNGLGEPLHLPRPVHHFQPMLQPHLPHYPPQSFHVVSCSPKGRVRIVRRPHVVSEELHNASLQA